MATLTQNFLSMADVYKRSDGMRGIADIIEMMNNTSQDIFEDFVMRECNNGTKHTHTIRTGLPSVGWGALYEGITQSKSSTQQVDDTTGFVESLCSIDTRLLELAGDNEAAVRASESEPFIEAMAQELVTAMFYHNPASNVRYPKGLAPRFSAKATSGAGNQIVDAGGTGSDNMSIWFVTWGGRSGLNALYPKGTTAGISQTDKGEQRVLDGNSDPYYVKEELVRSYMGFGLGDYRMVSRIANIDVSDLQAGSVDLYKYMRKAFYKLHTRRLSKIRRQEGEQMHTVIYANRDALEALDGLATNGGSSDNFTRLRPGEIEGKEVMTYRGIPIRETDALLNTEAQIT